MSGCVLYASAYVPAEWIAAHRMTPLPFKFQGRGQQRPDLQFERFLSDSAVSGTCASLLAPSIPGICPYARNFANTVSEVADAAAIIITTACDQMRRIAEFVESNCDTPVFLLNLPHTWQTPASFKLYLSELQRLGDFIVRLGGCVPSTESLCETIMAYEAARSELFISQRPQSTEGVPLALVGGPVIPGELDIFDLVKQAGGYVALDATENGERLLPAPIDRRSLRNDPFTALAESYFFGIHDAFRRPNSGLYGWLGAKFAEREVRGIVFRRYIWCDTWNAEAQRIKEWAGLPFLHLDVDDDGFDSVRTLTRLQAFVETLI